MAEGATLPRTSSQMSRPESRVSLVFSAPPMLKTAVPKQLNPLRRTFGGTASSDMGCANPNLSSIEIETLLREKVQEKYASLLQGFKTYNKGNDESVSRGEFRRVLESFCFPMTRSQFESVVLKAKQNADGNVVYTHFLDKFYGGDPKSKENWMETSYRNIQANLPDASPKEVSTDTVEKRLTDKLRTNMKDILKSLHLFDYNRDGRIHRHDFRKVLENYCFKLSDEQFQKLWLRNDFHHSGSMDYREFFRRLGIQVVQHKGLEALPRAKTDLQVTMTKGHDGANPYQKSLNFDQLNAQFRATMRSNYVSLKKAFIAVDRHLDGFVSLGDLRSILSAFTIPMSEHLFKQLMEKAEIRATGKVSWEYVLEKFQDPQAGANSQTIPIKPSHKFFPIREGDVPASSDELWALLERHIRCAFGSFKAAFLKLDEGRTGRITKRDVLKVLEQFKVKLTEEQVSKLMKRLDPEGANSIEYHAFLRIFEPRESEAAQKWLQSEHRFNSHRQPAVLAWEAVEVIMRDRITENWKEVAAKLVSYDPLGTALIHPPYLRKVFSQYGIPVSDEHFEYLMSCMEKPKEADSSVTSSTSDKVNYVEFFAKLGVDVSPGDTHGLSTQIFNDHNNSQQQRDSDFETRDAMARDSLIARASFLSAEEVLIRLRDRMSQHKKGIRDAFLSFDVLKKGRISRKVFRKLLAVQGLYLSDDQFRELCGLLNFHKGSLDYYAFIQAFDDPRGVSGTLVDSIKRTDNHHVNPIRGDEYTLSATQVEEKLRRKLRENFENLRAAFYKFDADHNGLLSKSDFRRLLDSFMLLISDSEFDVLCQRLGIEKKTKITYQDFLDRFQKQNSLEGQQWLFSDHRYNLPKTPPLFSAEQALEIIRSKALAMWKYISKAFITLDPRGKGKVSRQEFKELLKRFILPMTSAEYQKLWQRFDPDNRGYMTHEDFLNRFGADFAGGDERGISTKIVDGSLEKMEDHQLNMLEKHEVQTINQAMQSWHMPVKTIIAQLRERISNQSANNFHTVFKKYDREGRGSISVDDFQKILVDYSYFLADHQLNEFLTKIGFETSDSRLTYQQFVEAFEENRAETFQKAPKGFKFRSFEHLSPEKAEEKLRKGVCEQAAALTSVFQALDPGNSGRVPVEDFRRTLEAFCFIMSDTQFKYVVNRMKSKGHKEINYGAFLDAYQNMSGEEPSFIDKVMDDLRTPNDVSTWAVGPMLVRLRELVTERFYGIARQLSEIDYAKIGVVSQEDLRDVIQRHCFRMTDTQFSELCSDLVVNRYGNVDYKDFLKKFSRPVTPGKVDQSDGRRSAVFGRRPSSTMDGRKGEDREQGIQSRGAFRPNTTGVGRACTPLVNAESVESKLQGVIQRCWKDVQKECRFIDVANIGEVELSQFRDISKKYQFNLSSAEFHQLATKYDLRGNGKFCYTQFLKQFLFAMSPAKEPSPTDRRLIVSAKSKRGEEAPSEFFLNAMLRIRPTVIRDWKEMRRAFRGRDPVGSGTISPGNFRSILKDYRVNLSEDEFYHLLTYFDKDLSGKITYNDFIGAFLKGTI